MLHLNTILHPTDFSEQSEYAFRLACSLARDHGARLMVLHVVRPQVLYGEVGTLVPTGEYRDVALAQLEQVLSPDPAVTVEHRLEEGAAAEWIIAVAEEVHANLIVMGTHGRTGLGRLLLGSVAEQVLRKAPCPVLTLKGAPAYAFAEAEPVLAGAGDQAASEGEGI